jgi:pyruvate-formate lyase-activating enzyme
MSISGHHTAAAEGAPRRLSVVAITNLCNQSCIFCLDRDINGTYAYTTEEALSLLRRQAASGSDAVLFMGGEPSYRKDFLEILEECRRLGLMLSMATNGTVFADEARARAILDRGMRLIGFSLHSHDPVTANFLAGSPRTWEKQNQALRNLNRLRSEYDFTVVFKLVLSRWNYRALVDLVRYTDGLLADLPEVRYQLKMLRESGNDENWSLSYGVDVETARPHLRAFIEHIERHEPRLWLENTDGLPLCLLGEHAHRAREVEDLLRNLSYVGSEVRFGEYDHGIIWPGYTKPERCAGCSLDVICSGVWASWTRVHGRAGLPPQTRSPADVLARCVHYRRSVQEHLAGVLGCPVEEVVTRADEAVGRTLARIEREQREYRARRAAEQAAHEDRELILPREEDDPRVASQQDSRRRALSLVRALYPDFELETPCADGGWFLVDVQVRDGAATLSFSNRRQELRVRLHPAGSRQPVHLALPHLGLSYQLDGDPDQEQKRALRDIVTRLSRALRDRRIAPFAPFAAPDAPARARAPR